MRHRLVAQAALDSLLWSGDMAKKALLNSDVVVAVHANAATAFHPDLLPLFVDCPHEVQVGYIFVDGVFTAPAARAEPPAAAVLAMPTLLERAVERIDRYHADVVHKLVGSPTQVEIDTWSMKLEVARAIDTSTPISAAGQAFLVGAGFTTPAAQTAWSQKVLGNADRYATVVGLAEKIRTQAYQAVQSATDELSVETALATQRAAADTAMMNFLNSTGA